MSESSTSTPSVSIARPTVRINDKADDRVNELLVAMDMTEQEGGMSALELRFTNLASTTRRSPELAFEDGSILRFGASIAVYGGEETAPKEIFRGKITGLEIEFIGGNAPELVVLAEDVFQQARMARRTQVHSNVSIADVGKQLANQLSLKPVITGFTEKIGTQVQLNESDLAFLRRLVARYDGDLQVVSGVVGSESELHLSPRGEVQRGSLELKLPNQLQKVRVLADLAHQVTEVTVSGWNPIQGARVRSRSTGTHAGPGSGRSGAQVLSQTIGQRSHHISHLALTSDAEAQAVADAAFDLYARRFVCVEATAEGNPALRVGSHVTLRGLGDRFDNTFYVIRTRHFFDQVQGYGTDFEAECAFWGRN